MLTIDALLLLMLLYFHNLVTSIRFLPLFNQLHPAPQLIQKRHFFPLHINRGHFLLNRWKLEVQLDHWILAGLIPIKLYLLHLYLLTIHGSILIEMEEKFLGCLALRTLLLAIEDHFVIDECGCDLIIFLQIILIELLLEWLRCADVIVMILRLLMG